MPAKASPARSAASVPDPTEVARIDAVARRAFVHAIAMIYAANHRDDVMPGDPKVGGHPASSSSSVHILTALSMGVRRAEDVMAIKPHASPVSHALNYILRLMHRPAPQGPARAEKPEWLSDDEMAGAMARLRKFPCDGEPVFQSYHAAHDPDGSYYFPSGSVGIPPVVSIYSALAYRYAADHGFAVPDAPHFWSLLGDSEFREGSLMEALPDAAERELGNVTWIVDYNRQNLDGARMPNPRGLGGTDADRIERVVAANGWRVVQVRHGRRRAAAFAKKGGAALRAVLESGFSDHAFQMLLLAGEADAIRRAIADRDPAATAPLERLADDEVVALFADLGGHDVQALLTVLRDARARAPEGKPTLIIAHTIKGWGLECAAGHGNHSALPKAEELATLIADAGMDGPYDRFESGSDVGRFVEARGAQLRGGTEALWSAAARSRADHQRRIDAGGGLPETLGVNLKFLPEVHTQYIWGQVAAKLIRLGQQYGAEAGGRVSEPKSPLAGDELRWAPAAEMMLTMAPDVGTSTNINAAMDQRVYGVEAEPDWEAVLDVADRRRPTLAPHEDAGTRHLRFEIAEANCMSAVGAFGKLRDQLGVPLLPVMTVYDFFLKRCLGQLYYNLYWRSGFIVVGTPSGVTLSPEGAQHSWKSDIQMPNLICWEPCFGVEVDWILSDAVRRHQLGEDGDRSGVVVRGVTRALRQAEMLERLRTAQRFAGQDDAAILEATRQDVLRGGYRLVDHRGADGYEPGENVVELFAMGAMVTEALGAADRLLAEGIYANVTVVTSADLLCGRLARADRYAHLRRGLGVSGDLHLSRRAGQLAIEDRADLILAAGRRVPIVAVVDGEPGLLDNLGSVVGVRAETLGVEMASKCGRPVDVYGYLGIDAAAIYDAVGRVLTETALEDVRMDGRALTGGEAGANAGSLWPPRS